MALGLETALKILVLVTDAHGGKGGIAKFNVDFLAALCSAENVKDVVCVPRLFFTRPAALSPKLKYLEQAANGLARYLRVILFDRTLDVHFDAVFCAHIHLLPFAVFLARRCKAPLHLVVYGFEAWKPNRIFLRFFLRGLASFISISEFTKQKFYSWSQVSAPSFILPCCVDLERFHPGPKPERLMRRFGLQGKKVLLTLGRLAASEQLKGHDRVISALPALLKQIPDIVYLIAGEGDDRKNLERQAILKGVEKSVIFAGFVEESDKPEFYRLADAYVMPSRGEGFGIVFLEALASGLPVVGSSLDAGKEVLQDGKLGILVDPDDPFDIQSGILRALRSPIRPSREKLEHFSYSSFERACHRILNEIAISQKSGG